VCVSTFAGIKFLSGVKFDEQRRDMEFVRMTFFEEACSELVGFCSSACFVKTDINSVFPAE